MLIILTVGSAWTGPPALAGFASTGWDTSSALLALKVLLHATQVYQCLWNKKFPCVRVILKSQQNFNGHLTKIWSVMLKSTLVGHLKSVM